LDIIAGIVRGGSVAQALCFLGFAFYVDNGAFRPSGKVRGLVEDFYALASGSRFYGFHVRLRFQA
jgi:hypothetical protein